VKGGEGKKGKGRGGKRMEEEGKGNGGPTYKGKEGEGRGGRGKGRGKVPPVITVSPGSRGGHWTGPNNTLRIARSVMMGPLECMTNACTDRSTYTNKLDYVSYCSNRTNLGSRELQQTTR